METRKSIFINDIKVKKQFKDLLWVLKARSADTIGRITLCYINIDDNGYCCTDGRRLHLHKDKSGLPSGLENGLYDVKVGKDYIAFHPMEGDFPSYMDVIPQYESNPIEIDLVFGKQKNHSMRNSIALTKISGLLENESSINYEYIKDLEGYYWKVQAGDKYKPIKFVDGDFLAIVMPLRIS